MNAFVSLTVMAVALTTSALEAQGLAELARQEAARRKTVVVPGRVFTNADLPLEMQEPRGPSGAEAPQASAAPPDERDPAAGADAEVLRGEKYWKDLIDGARAAQDRTKVLIDAVESRLRALATDIASRDDPAERGRLERDRQQTLKVLAALTAELEEQRGAGAALEERARQAKVPPGWIR